MQDVLSLGSGLGREGLAGGKREREMPLPTRYFHSLKSSPFPLIRLDSYLFSAVPRPER